MLWVGLAGGLWAGITSALGAKRMHKTSGVAMLHDEGSWLTSFDAGDASELHTFYGDQMWWKPAARAVRVGCRASGWARRCRCEWAGPGWPARMAAVARSSAGSRA